MWHEIQFCDSYKSISIAKKLFQRMNPKSLCDAYFRLDLWNLKVYFKCCNTVFNAALQSAFCMHTWEESEVSLNTIKIASKQGSMLH